MSAGYCRQPSMLPRAAEMSTSRPWRLSLNECSVCCSALAEHALFLSVGKCRQFHEASYMSFRAGLYWENKDAAMILLDELAEVEMLFALNTGPHHS